jgi:hypothetical protein
VVERAELLADERSDARTGQGWAGRMARALAFGLGKRDNVIVALAGFLVRGGILVLALPAAILPSVIGLAGATGVDAFGIDGRPTAWLFEIVAVGVVGVVVSLALASFIGSLIDVWLIEAAIDGAGTPVREGRPLPRTGLLIDMISVRGFCLLPLAGAIAWAGSRIYSAAYAELTTPTNLVTPLPVRVIESAADAIVVVVLAWLVTETIAAIAVRRMVLADHGVVRSIGGAIAQVLRRPLSTAGTVLATTGATLLATALAVAATSTAFDWCRIAARNEEPIAITLGMGPLSTTRDFRPVVFVLTALVLAVAWVAAAALSGAASAWRSAAWTGEVLTSISNDRIDPDDAELGLSGKHEETSGD